MMIILRSVDADRRTDSPLTHAASFLRQCAFYATSSHKNLASSFGPSSACSASKKSWMEGSCARSWLA